MTITKTLPAGAGALVLLDGVTKRFGTVTAIGKTGARTRAEAICVAVQNGWLLGR